MAFCTAMHVATRCALCKRRLTSVSLQTILRYCDTNAGDANEVLLEETDFHSGNSVLALDNCVWARFTICFMAHPIWRGPRLMLARHVLALHFCVGGGQWLCECVFFGCDRPSICCQPFVPTPHPPSKLPPLVKATPLSKLQRA